MDDLTRIPLTTRLREGRSDGTDLRWTVQPIHVEASNRIAELEAERDGLRAALRNMADVVAVYAMQPPHPIRQRDRVAQDQWDQIATVTGEMLHQALGAKP